MPRQPRVIDLPPLSVDELHELDLYEKRLRAALDKCQDRDSDNFDEHKTKEWLRAYAVQFFDFYAEAYAKHSDFSTSWLAIIKKQTVIRVVTCLDQALYCGRAFIDYSVEELHKTLTEHISRTGRKLHKTDIVLSLPSATRNMVGDLRDAGVDLSSASPLLIMAAKQASIQASHQALAPIPPQEQKNTVSDVRRAFVQPLLDEKGWDVAAWAKKAKVSRHTAKSYLEGKRRTYHSSMKDLAEAIGVSFQDFPK